MRQTACINVTKLPLQIVLKRDPALQTLPVAIIDHDLVSGKVILGNSIAFRNGVRHGMKLKTALSLVGNIRFVTLSSIPTASVCRDIAKQLREYSSFVETSPTQPGLFWMNSGGMNLLFENMEEWAKMCSGALFASLHLSHTMIVGFNSFYCYAVAKSLQSQSIIVFKNPEEERRQAWQCPVNKLIDTSEIRLRFSQFGITTLSDFIQLPAQGIQNCFGSQAYELYQLATGKREKYISPDILKPDISRTHEFEYPILNLQKIMPLIRSMMSECLEELNKIGLKVSTYTIDCFHQNATRITTVTVKPTNPTLDEKHLEHLLEVNLQSTVISAEIEAVRITTTGRKVNLEQPALFREALARDLSKASKALELINAEFGDKSVCKAELVPEVLPERRYRWTVLKYLAIAKPAKDKSQKLIRRIFNNIEPLSASIQKNLAFVSGPFVISGGWIRSEFERHYYFAESMHGTLTWLYFDSVRKKWFQQGDLI